MQGLNVQHLATRNPAVGVPGSQSALGFASVGERAGPSPSTDGSAPWSWSTAQIKDEEWHPLSQGRGERRGAETSVTSIRVCGLKKMGTIPHNSSSCRKDHVFKPSACNAGDTGSIPGSG